MFIGFTGEKISKDQIRQAGNDVLSLRRGWRTKPSQSNLVIIDTDVLGITL